MALLRRTSLFTAVLFVTILAPSVRAEDDVETARTKFADGVRLYRAGDNEGARVAFLEAEHAHHAAVTLYNLALVEERLGHVQAAVDDYERYLAEAGEKGEFSGAAAVAVAELRRRSGKVRIDTEPPGAHLFVDGMPLEDLSPTSVLLPAGRHHVTVEWNDARASADLDVASGTPARVRIEHPPLPAQPVPPVATEPAPPPPPSEKRPEPPPAEVDGLVLGGAFYAIPIAMFKSNSPQNKNDTQAIFAGISADVGYAFADHAYVGIRAIGAMGASCHVIAGAHIATIGPVIEVHLTRRLWVGASANGGTGEDCKADGARLSTDFVFSPMLDASYAITDKTYGQWLVTLGVGYFFANPTNDNGMLYAPLGFGPRFY